MLAAGKRLREERERQGLSLEAIAANTKIPPRTLAAIEEDEISFIQTPFFYKSFVKQYADALHVNYADLEEAVNANLSDIPVPLVPGQDHHAPDIAPIRIHNRGPRWAMPIVSLVVVMTACSAIYAFVERTELSHFSAMQRLTGESASGIRKDAISSASQADAPNKEIETPSVSEANRPDLASRTGASAAGMPGDDIFLRIAAVEKTWLSIEADGKSVYNGLLQPEDTKVFEGHDTAKIRTGNAGGLTVTFNGKEIGRLGERGQVRTVLFTRDQYEILQPNLTSELNLLPVSTVSE